jgi:glycosyltransferase involved in cell wall biosynthesis
MELNGITIVIPVYNEREAIAATLARMRCIIDKVEKPCEVIFVDDGSDDGTRSILETVSDSGFRVIRHAINRGYGASLKTGLAAASNDICAITDADGSYPDDLIPRLFHQMKSENFDMIVGSRTGPNAHLPLIRQPAKWFLSQIAIILSGRKIPDLNSGLRLIRKSALMRFLRILPDGFSFTTTITLAMLTNGYAVKYVPIGYTRRTGKSKIRPVYDTLNFLQLICRTVLYFNPLRIFIPLAFVTFLTSLGVLLFSWKFLEKPMDATFGILFMTSVMILAIGLLADLIDKRFQ